MRSNYVIANWKMNFTLQDALHFASALKGIENYTKVKTVICAPYIYLLKLAEAINTEQQIALGAQDVSQHKEGAYTGEVAAFMLQSIGVKYAIVGHSERRAYFKETDTELTKKIQQLNHCTIQPIFCVGELLEEREKGNHFDLVEKQIKSVVGAFDKSEVRRWIIAYEPVWSIGTGKTATPKQAQEMHHHIRNVLKQCQGKEAAKNISILYGGSVKPDNAKEIFSCPDVDGGLIGGASLSPSSFSAIIEARL